MNIMNKLYKCALGLLTTFIITCCCFSSADDVEDLITKVCPSDNPNCNYFFTNLSLNNTYQVVYTLSDTSTNVDIRGHTICMKFSNWGNNNTSDVFVGFANNTNNAKPYNSLQYDQNKLDYQCMYVNSTYSYRKIGIGAGTSPNTVNIEVFLLDDLLASALPEMTSLECQTKYSLIPISEITANYCKLNFDLIDPMDCPINEGTGAIVRSNLTINNTPYAQNQNINVFIPDFLAWNVAFNDYNTVIEVEGYNADESYIENVINNEKLTPTNEDFEDMLTGFMTNYFPYLALALVFLYLARKIFKLFK